MARLPCKIILSMAVFVLLTVYIILTMCFYLWFYVASRLDLLAVEEWDFSDVLIILMVCELLLFFVSAMGLILISYFDKKIFHIYVLSAVICVILKLFAVILFFLREENRLFSSAYKYFTSNNNVLPEKYHAWKYCYYNSYVSLPLEFIMICLGIYLLYSLFEKIIHNIEIIDNIYYEIPNIIQKNNQQIS